jgi:hypothetical protein
MVFLIHGFNKLTLMNGAGIVKLSVPEDKVPDLPFILFGL